jgi:hypothetical protein
MEDKIQNATISDVCLGVQDHGLLTVSITCSYGSSAFQAFGGYCLFSMTRWHNGDDRDGNFAGWFINRMLEIADVSDIKKMEGKNIRVQIANGFIVAIGHITEDEWMNPKEDIL